MRLTARRAGAVNALATERKSLDDLMQKMGLSYIEAQDILELYGVSASQLIELMQLSKYEFVFETKKPLACAPCPLAIRPVRIGEFEPGEQLRG